MKTIEFDSSNLKTCPFEKNACIGSAFCENCFYNEKTNMKEKYILCNREKNDKDVVTINKGLYYIENNNECCLTNSSLTIIETFKNLDYLINHLINNKIKYKLNTLDLDIFIATVGYGAKYDTW